MTPKRIKEQLAELNPDALLADGFERALIGYVDRSGNAVALYDILKCIDVLMKDGASYEEANDYLACNVLCAYVGENGPMFADILNNSSLKKSKKSKKLKKKRSEYKGEELFLF